MTLALHRPKPDEYAEFYETYIRLVPDSDLLETLSLQVRQMSEILGSIDASTSATLHAPYTWTIKQVLGHLIDCERIFGGRAHRFACGDRQPLPGIDQDTYVANQNFETSDLPTLTKEWIHCRQANLMFLNRISPENWNYRGEASGHSFTVRSLAYILAGHITYHLNIIKTRVA